MLPLPSLCTPSSAPLGPHRDVWILKTTSLHTLSSPASVWVLKRRNGALQIGDKSERYGEGPSVDRTHVYGDLSVEIQSRPSQYFKPPAHRLTAESCRSRWGPDRTPIRPQLSPQ